MTSPLKLLDRNIFKLSLHKAIMKRGYTLIVFVLCISLSLASAETKEAYIFVGSPQIVSLSGINYSIAIYSIEGELVSSSFNSTFYQSKVSDNTLTGVFSINNDLTETMSRGSTNIAGGVNINLVYFGYTIWEYDKDHPYIGAKLILTNLASGDLPICAEECSPAGNISCYGNYIQTCGNYDTDSCLEWNMTAYCSYECINDICSSTVNESTNCSNETCNSNELNASCTNECSASGLGICSGSYKKLCGNYDSDSCFEWGETYCSYGCVNGNCSEPALNETCYDYDNGVNPTVPSYIIYSYIFEGENQTIHDKCINNTLLAEAVCNNGIGNSVNYECANCLVEGENAYCETAAEPLKVEDQITTPIVIQGGFACESGCLVDEKCLPYGFRKSDKYCSLNNTLVDQINEGACENDFECRSNLCADGECTTPGFFKKILDWFRNLFGIQ
jgi:hypothetical protein